MYFILNVRPWSRVSYLSAATHLTFDVYKADIQTKIYCVDRRRRQNRNEIDNLIETSYLAWEIETKVTKSRRKIA